MFLSLWIRSPEFLMLTGIMVPKNGVRTSVIAFICVLWVNRIVLVLKCSILLVLSRNVFTFFNSSAVLVNLCVYRPFVGLTYVLSF